MVNILGLCNDELLYDNIASLWPAMDHYVDETIENLEFTLDTIFNMRQYNQLVLVAVSGERLKEILSKV